MGQLVAGHRERILTGQSPTLESYRLGVRGSMAWVWLAVLALVQEYGLTGRQFLVQSGKSEKSFLIDTQDDEATSEAPSLAEDRRQVADYRAQCNHNIIGPDRTNLGVMSDLTMDVEE